MALGVLVIWTRNPSRSAGLAATGVVVLIAALMPPAAGAAGRYVATGDSVAAGFAASDPPTRGYVPLFFDFLKTRTGGGLDQLVNRAVPGTTSGGMRTNGQLAAARGDIDDRSTDTKVVTVTIGGNDALGGDCASGFGERDACPFVANFEAILRELKNSLAADPGAEELLVTTYYNPSKGTPNEPRARGRLLGTDSVVDCAGTGAEIGLNDAISCRGAALGAIVVDVYPAFYESQ